MTIIIIPRVLLFADQSVLRPDTHAVIPLAIPGFLFFNLLHYKKITDKMQESPAISFIITCTDHIVTVKFSFWGGDANPNGG